MTERPEGPGPEVFARLNAEANERWEPMTPSRWARPAGFVVLALIVVMVIVALRAF